MRLERINIQSEENTTPHRTRSALVAEFKEKNIMTRNRHSLDRIKSTTQRVEHLKKIAPNMLDQQYKSRTEAKQTTSRQSSPTASQASTPSSGKNKNPAHTLKVGYRFPS